MWSLEKSPCQPVDGSARCASSFSFSISLMLFLHAFFPVCMLPYEHGWSMSYSCALLTLAYPPRVLCSLVGQLLLTTPTTTSRPPSCVLGDKGHRHGCSRREIQIRVLWVIRAWEDTMAGRDYSRVAGFDSDASRLIGNKIEGSHQTKWSTWPRSRFSVAISPPPHPRLAVGRAKIGPDNQSHP
jgi:hypothetical protein